VSKEGAFGLEVGSLKRLVDLYKRYDVCMYVYVFVCICVYVCMCVCVCVCVYAIGGSV
jgi:hypothetical protein